MTLWPRRMREAGRIALAWAVLCAPGGATDAPSKSTAAASGAQQGFLYGRVVTDDGTVYEGRLRCGGDEEAFWDHWFNGARDGNPWADQAPAEQLKTEVPIEIFGVEVAQWKHRRNLERPFMARFGDISRIHARGRDLRVTLKSGTVVELDRFGADDFADGIRVWDARRGVVDLDEWNIRVIEFLPTPPLGAVPHRLHGTVSTPQGDFTGSLQWDREEGVVTDTLDGHSADWDLKVPFESIRSIERASDDSSEVATLDGHTVVLSGTRNVGRGNRGVYVEDPRYGRVLVSWEAFERLVLTPGDSGPAYHDFPAGRPLAGGVTMRDGRRLTGRLVYDLDESETTETLDAPSQGVNYTIPFGLIASIVLPDSEKPAGRRARVMLHSGEELRLERTGDLGEGNAGLLVFEDVRKRPEYVPWADVERVDLERPPAMHPRFGRR